jgi:isopropylmalate/homocitrate/citramalate synthase
MFKSIVSIVKGTDTDKLVDEALSLLGGVDSLIKPNSTVVVKPNAGHPFPQETSVNTSPAVVSAVIKALRKAKPKQIILAEASAIGCDTMESLEVSGIRKAAEDAGADIINVPDTVGTATPEKMYDVISQSISTVKIPISVHCHNDFGLAVANSLAGVR